MIGMKFKVNGRTYMNADAACRALQRDIERKAEQHVRRELQRLKSRLRCRGIRVK